MSFPMVGCSTRVTGDACVRVMASLSMSGWRPAVKFVVGWVREMLVGLSVMPLGEGGEEEGRKRGGTIPVVDPGWTCCWRGVA